MKFNFGMPVRAPYGVLDMAHDALGVLDVLGVAQAHVVGVSMGGMIAQRMAIVAPQRVRSLVSVMSTSGARDLPNPSAKVQLALLGRPSRSDEEAIVRHYLRLFQVIGSPGFPHPPYAIEERVREAVRRSYHPPGVLRQTLASIADTGRAEALATIRTPTLVLHGRDDPLVPYACGVDTARRIPGARIKGFVGMGHDLPPGVVELLMGELLPHLAAT